MLELTIESLAFGGQAVARHDGYVIFVDGPVLPGERVRARLTKRKSSHGEAALESVVQAAPERRVAPCNLFGTCGGCSWQHAAPPAQIAAKQRIVADALRQIAGLTDVAMEPLVASPTEFEYRNKMEFTFARRADGALVSGFHKPEDWRTILDVTRCHLAPEGASRLLRAVVAEGERQRLAAWDPRVHRGTLRQLVVRHSVHEDAWIALLLTGDEEGLDFAAMEAAARQALPNLKGFAWGLNANRSDVARAERVIATSGDLTLVERLLGLEFRITMNSFFQTNSCGAERLYEVVRRHAGLTGGEALLDAYCGTGTIGQICAPLCRAVYGIELVREAVWDARENARRNGLANCTFMAGDMFQTLPSLMDSIEGRIDRLVVDPPRGGMEKRALERLLRIGAPVMVYVSCNPTTMARDLVQAAEAGYRVEVVTPVDMFPQTYHVECVARLVRSGAPSGG